MNNAMKSTVAGAVAFLVHILMSLGGPAAAVSSDICERDDLSANTEAHCDSLTDAPDALPGVCFRPRLSEETQRTCDRIRFADAPHYNVVRLTREGAVRAIHLHDTATGDVLVRAYPHGIAFSALDEGDREVRMRVEALEDFVAGRPTPADIGASQRADAEEAPAAPHERARGADRLRGPVYAALASHSIPVQSDASVASRRVAQAGSSNGFAEGLPIGWNGSTGIATEQCLNYAIQRPSNNVEQASFSSRNTASSTADQLNVSATVKGSVDAFKASDTFSYSDAWQSSTNSNNQYFNFYSLYSLTTAVDPGEPLNSAGKNALAANNFATACGIEYTSGVTVGMLATISINYGSSTESTQTRVSNSFEASFGLDSISTAVSTANSQTNSSSYFTFNMTIYGGGPQAASALNSAFASENSQGEAFYASCAAGNASDCAGFSSSMGSGASSALTKFGALVDGIDQASDPDISFFETFPGGVAGATTTRLVTTPVPTVASNDVLQPYAHQLQTYVDLLNQVGTLDNRAQLLNTLLSRHPEFNPSSLLDVRSYVVRLVDIYGGDRTTLLSDLDVCLSATSANVGSKCAPVIQNQATNVVDYYASSPATSLCSKNGDCFFAEQNALALQYTGQAKTTQGSLSGSGPFDALYIDQLPSFSAAGASTAIEGLPALAHLSDRPIPDLSPSQPAVGLIVLQSDKPISTTNLAEVVQEESGKFDFWIVVGSEPPGGGPITPLLFKNEGASFTSNACTPTFTAVCAIDYRTEFTAALAMFTAASGEIGGFFRAN